MKKKKIIGMIVFVCMFLVLSNAAKAEVLDFESIFSYSTEQVPANYGGFNWGSNLEGYSQESYNSVTSYNNTATFPSPHWAIYNVVGTSPVTVTSSSNFDFNGAYFSPWLRNNQMWNFASTSITMKGYNGSIPVGEVTYQLTNGFSYCAADFLNVNRLEFSGPASGKFWLMDDFTYNGGNVVPEPASILLFGLGGGAMAFTRRKRS